MNENNFVGISTGSDQIQLSAQSTEDRTAKLF